MITPEQIAEAAELAEVRLAEEYAPETPADHVLQCLWAMETQTGRQIYFKTTLDNYKRYLVTYTAATDTSAVEVIVDSGKGI